MGDNTLSKLKHLVRQKDCKSNILCNAWTLFTLIFSFFGTKLKFKSVYFAKEINFHNHYTQMSCLFKETSIVKIFFNKHCFTLSIYSHTMSMQGLFGLI